MPTSPPIDLPTVTIPCYRCGYDVRAQPVNGRCPECAASVADSRRLALIPRRPAWRDADPRWRRRILTGSWMLVLMPLMAVLQQFQWTERIPAPIFYDVQRGQSLDESCFAMVYLYFMFCIGLVLLFSKERNRQPARLDWTQRWGVTGSYGVLLLGIPAYAFIMALVIIGIAALLQSMPLRYQPAVTPLLVKLGTGYVYYGPHPTLLAEASLACCSSIVVLLACVPLFNALRSSGPRVPAAIVLAPLALSAVVQVGYVLAYALHLNPLPPDWVGNHFFYFNPEALASWFGDPGRIFFHGNVIAEAAKWLACVGIAVWLTIAQISAICWRRRLVRTASKRNQSTGTQEALTSR
ncbi:MAG TPA: hypothetical protein VLI90_02560 [Tepidisphaeraceae bacterium]|nr:hypothetical protein [Tepidisphaeraceae bacterium]